MSFFHKKMSQNVWATIMPFGPVTLIFYWPQKFFSGTVIGLNSFNKTNLTLPCLKFIKNTWINKYVICGKQYFAV